MALQIKKKPGSVPYHFVEQNGSFVGSLSACMAYALAMTGHFVKLREYEDPGLGLGDGYTIADWTLKDSVNDYGVFGANFFEGGECAETGSRYDGFTISHKDRWVAYGPPSALREFWRWWYGDAFKDRNYLSEQGLDKFGLHVPGSHSTGWRKSFLLALRALQPYCKTIPGYEPRVVDEPRFKSNGMILYEGPITHASILLLATLWSGGVFVIIQRHPATVEMFLGGVFPVKRYQVNEDSWFLSDSWLNVAPYYIGLDFTDLPERLNQTIGVGSLCLLGRGCAWGTPPPIHPGAKPGGFLPYAYQGGMVSGSGDFTEFDALAQQFDQIAFEAYGVDTLAFNVDCGGLADTFFLGSPNVNVKPAGWWNPYAGLEFNSLHPGGIYANTK